MNKVLEGFLKIFKVIFKVLSLLIKSILKVLEVIFKVLSISSIESQAHMRAQEETEMRARFKIEDVKGKIEDYHHDN